MSDDDEGFITVVGIVGIKTDKPLVQFAHGEVKWEMSVDDALKFAQDILEATFNATYDAAILHFFRDEMKLEMDEAAKVMQGVRLYRLDRWGQPDLPPS